MHDFPERLFARLTRLRVHGTGVVAVSGGPDSVALLRGLHELSRSGQLPDVPDMIVAHLNHCLRGEESDTDEAFVRELADQLGIECVSTSIELTGRVGTNLEQEARRERYTWLGNLAISRNASWVATGHTADDQAETILFRLLRGSGIDGLRGIAIERILTGPVRLIRPMLDLRREEGVQFLNHLGQEYRIDRSNTDVRWTRNRIRAELMPVLMTYNPRLVEILGQLAEQASETSLLIAELAVARLTEAELPRDGAVIRLSRTVLAGCSRHLIREVFRLLWQRENWPTGRMRYREWDALAGLTLGENRAVDLPGRVHARLHRHEVRLTR